MGHGGVKRRRNLARSPSHSDSGGDASCTPALVKIVRFACLAILFTAAGATHASAAPGDPCGRDGELPCVSVTSVSPSLLTTGEIDTATVFGGALDTVTSVALDPGNRDLDFTITDASKLLVYLPHNLGEGNYKLVVTGRGATVTTPTMAVVAPGPPASVTTPPPPPAATPAPTAKPSVAAVAAPGKAPGPPPPPPPATSWLLIIAVGVVGGSLAAAYVGVRWRIAKRQRLEEMDEALVRLWAIDKNVGKSSSRRANSRTVLPR
jgi:hypothetical protein